MYKALIFTAAASLVVGPAFAADVEAMAVQALTGGELSPWDPIKSLMESIFY